MSRFGLSLFVGGVVLGAIGFATALAGVTTNSDIMIFGGSVVGAVGVGLIVSGFYTIARGILEKIKVLAETMRFLAKVEEEKRAREKE
ncbi:MAG: hypothetical protein DRJ67_06315 [Thermoprotei archaeon]|nr:MAG: hypothetical protein DRJ67_06315 [Thermoprotei archaeon]